MMKIRAEVLLLMIGMLVCAQSHSASAREMTAGDLQQICSSQDSEADISCRLYILGIAEGITIGMSMADGKVVTGRPCIPDTISDSKLETLVKAQLGADLMVNPGDRSLPASSFIGAVIGTSFACRPHRAD